MNISGILISALPAHVPGLVEALGRLPLTEVTQVDEGGGRIVVVLERATFAQESDALRTLRQLPHVLSAERVMHYFGEDVQRVHRPAEEVAPRP